MKDILFYCCFLERPFFFFLVQEPQIQVSLLCKKRLFFDKFGEKLLFFLFLQSAWAGGGGGDRGGRGGAGTDCAPLQQ